LQLEAYFKPFCDVSFTDNSKEFIECSEMENNAHCRQICDYLNELFSQKDLKNRFGFKGVIIRCPKDSKTDAFYVGDRFYYPSPVDLDLDTPIQGLFLDTTDPLVSNDILLDGFPLLIIGAQHTPMNDQKWLFSICHELTHAVSLRDRTFLDRFLFKTPITHLLGLTEIKNPPVFFLFWFSWYCLGLFLDILPRNSLKLILTIIFLCVLPTIFIPSIVRASLELSIDIKVIQSLKRWGDPLHFGTFRVYVFRHFFALIILCLFQFILWPILVSIYLPVV
jgi:hypothetical protein